MVPNALRSKGQGEVAVRFVRKDKVKSRCALFEKTIEKEFCFVRYHKDEGVRLRWIGKGGGIAEHSYLHF